MSGSKDTPVPRGKRLPDPLDLVAEIKGLIEETRAMVVTTVNAGLTVLSRRVGRQIHEEILKHGRAEYGQKILPTLSAKLLAEYGRGWSQRNLAYMIRVAEVLPDSQRELCARLSWSHIRQIIYIKDVLKRDFRTEMCRVEGWSTRTLDKVSALMRQLSWTHFLPIIYLKEPLQREFYAEVCRIERWSTFTLQKKIGSVLHEGTTLSRRHLEERSVKLEGRTGK